MTKPHGIIFTGWKVPTIQIIPQAGAYRMRTYLEQNGYCIEVVDHIEHWPINEILAIIDSLYHDGMIFIGFSLSFYLYLKEGVLKAVKLRWPHLKIVLGGQEVTTYVKDYPLADKVIMGYSETAFLHYLDFLTGKRPDDLEWIEDEATGVPYIIADKKYPYTNTADLTINWKQDDPYVMNTLPLETSRGCIFKCLFCSYPLIGKKKMDYLRDVDNIADELKRNYDMFGTESYVFMDDTVNESVAKLEHINKGIKKSGVKISFSCYMRIDLVSAFPEMIDIMLDMGLVGGFLGIESMNEIARKKIGKGLTNEKLLNAIDEFHKHDKSVRFTAGLIVGLPGESIESIFETNTWMIEQKRRYFDRWDWNPLYMTKHQRWLKSDFDRNAHKYNFRYKTDDPMDNTWETDIMDFTTAEIISKRLNDEGQDHYGIGAWMISEFSNYGITMEEMENMSWKEALAILQVRRPIIVEKYKQDIRRKLGVHK